MSALRIESITDGERKKPLRRPKHSTTSGHSQYMEISDEWRERRDKMMSLTRENYLTKGKNIAREFQLCIQENKSNVKRVIYIIHERAAKDIHSYPIAALFFEDLGRQIDGTCDGEKIFDSLQKELQASLSSLNSKLARAEKLTGCDVGITFLLYSLLKLEKQRSGDGKFFKDLLLKLFKAFYLYVLDSSMPLQQDINDSLVSALCTILVVVNEERSTPKDEQKIEQILGFLRKTYIHSFLKGIGKIQIAWTAEAVASGKRKTNLTTKEFYAQRYALACRRVVYLLDSMETVLCDISAPGTKSDDQIVDSHNDSHESDIFIDAVPSDSGSSADSKQVIDKTKTDHGSRNTDGSVSDLKLGGMEQENSSNSASPDVFHNEKCFPLDEKKREESLVAEDESKKKRSFIGSTSSSELQKFINTG